MTASAAPMRRLLSDEPPRYLSETACATLAAHARAAAEGGGETWLEFNSWWRGAVRWARNRSLGAIDRRDVFTRVARLVGGATAEVFTNQVDDASLTAAVRAAEQLARYRPGGPREAMPSPPPVTYPRVSIWSDATFDLDGDARGAAARALMTDADAAGLMAAGYLEVHGGGRAIVNAAGDILYAPSTQAQCDVTIRSVTHAGSGWAGLSSYDWNAIEPHDIARRALDKCLRSQNPVAIEPGRYTTLLEPQAVSQLTMLLVQNLSRERAELGIGPFAEHPTGTTKLGQRLLDPRVDITHDPSDPMLGVVPFAGWGEPYRPVAWFRQGVLHTLAYGREYAVSELDEPLGYPNSFAYRMSGGTASIEAMIAGVERGLWVTRFSPLQVLDQRRLLASGFTRDGLWLIEHGRVSKAVKNLQMLESPLYALNQIEALGVPTPVFNPGRPVIVPPALVRDFNFPRLADAV